MSDRPTVIAHRGASGYAREHTLAAYDLALAQGADALELDVRPAADGELVLVHDPTLERTTGDPRRVDELPAAALCALGHPAAPLPLRAVLDRYAARTRFVIDLKDPHPDWELRVVEAIDARALRGRVELQSFDHGALARVHRRAPWLPLAPLYRRAQSIGIHVRDVPAFAHAIGPCHIGVDAALVEAARARRLAVRPWTVDFPDEAERLLGLGIRALITNRPDVIAGMTPPASRLAAAA
ncbi:MAG TPA: glycerophosphodiester phosphodiesterase [Solirubrobacteraceae bacterium]|nr:glycerophosphodiester phosphodiesterase [Solirubrobacteraceae bacterium]